MLWSLAYLVARNLFALVWLLARPRRSKELEILVLRHELAILRRQARQPKLTRADRALLAAPSRSLPRVVWRRFPVKPGTLLRWHRQLVARRWTYMHRTAGRRPLESSLRALILRLGHENPHRGYIGGARLQLEHLTLLNHLRTSSIDNEIEESHRRSNHDHPRSKEGVSSSSRGQETTAR